MLRRVAPALHVGGRTVVTRHAGEVEVLRRDDDFTLRDQRARMERRSSSFLLGMGRGRDYEREQGALRRVARPNDLPRVRHVVAQTAGAW